MICLSRSFKISTNPIEGQTNGENVKQLGVMKFILRERERETKNQ
jgi:hypothetical protein